MRVVTPLLLLYVELPRTELEFPLTVVSVALRLETRAEVPESRSEPETEWVPPTAVPVLAPVVTRLSLRTADDMAEFLSPAICVPLIVCTWFPLR